MFLHWYHTPFTFLVIFSVFLTSSATSTGGFRVQILLLMLGRRLRRLVCSLARQTERRERLCSCQSVSHFFGESRIHFVFPFLHALSSFTSQNSLNNSYFTRLHWLEHVLRSMMKLMNEQSPFEKEIPKRKESKTATFCYSTSVFQVGKHRLVQGKSQPSRDPVSANQRRWFALCWGFPRHGVTINSELSRGEIPAVLGWKWR